MRGYFGIGAEGISKAMNMGALARTAHAFEASFIFSVCAHGSVRDMHVSDTSRSDRHVPHYLWRSIDEMNLPHGCTLVGVEMCPDAAELPKFRHPRAAAYVLGPEKGSLSPQMRSRCQYMVRIPTRFCINVSLAGALVMYDRMLKIHKNPMPRG